MRSPRCPKVIGDDVTRPKSGEKNCKRLGKKFDHKAIKKPGLLYLTGMAGSRQNLQLAIGYTRLEREGPLMGALLAPGQDYRRTGDALVMAVRIGLRERFELVDDRLHIGLFVAFSEKVREEMRQRHCAKCRAQILERVCPAIVYAVGRGLEYKVRPKID